MAGNEYLADYARANNHAVTIIPTTIDTDKYDFIERTDEPETITIGWSGSFSTIQRIDADPRDLAGTCQARKFPATGDQAPVLQDRWCRCRGDAVAFGDGASRLAADRYRPDAAAG
ncbi:MAG: hypothetical protein IPJ55_17505 [Chloracidobacterium sp.]|nr:hypothetical protein [Chloracidobacterium sp.]